MNKVGWFIMSISIGVSWGIFIWILTHSFPLSFNLSFSVMVSMLALDMLTDKWVNNE